MPGNLKRSVYQKYKLFFYSIIRSGSSSDANQTGKGMTDLRMPSTEAAATRLEKLLRAVRRTTPVPFTQRDAERILAALRTTDNLWEALRLSHVPMRAVCAFWHRLLHEGLVVRQDGHLRLTPEGQAWVEALGIAPARELHCARCEGRGVDYQQLPQKVIERFAQICRNRPAALQDYDQGFVTEATTLARIAFAWQRGDLEGKALIVLGDDDLMSIAAALTGAPQRVVAVDIDQRLVAFINDIARQENLPLEAVHYDLSRPLPATWQHHFDTFMTDPTESLLGFQTTILRGLHCLRGPGSAGYFGLTHAESSLEKWTQIQQFLLKQGTVITDLIDGFSAYVNWDYFTTMRAWSWLPAHEPPDRLWYFSALYRIELLRPFKAPNVTVEGDLFNDEEAATT